MQAKHIAQRASLLGGLKIQLLSLPNWHIDFVARVIINALAYKTLCCSKCHVGLFVPGDNATKMVTEPSTYVLLYSRRHKDHMLSTMETNNITFHNLGLFLTALTGWGKGENVTSAGCQV